MFFVNISANSIDWFTAVNITVTTTDWFSEINISATNIDCFTELNISVTNIDCFTEAHFSKLQSPTLIILDDYTQSVPYLCTESNAFYVLSVAIIYSIHSTLY